MKAEGLMTGDHTLSRCWQVTETVLREVFSQLRTQGFVLEGTLLKPNMILPGATCPNQVSAQTVADATITCLRRAVPAAVAGIVSLSGGQSGDLASCRLNAINTDRGRLPWPVAVSFGRAFQQPDLTIWDGDDANVARAQDALLQRSRSNQAARGGAYTPIGIDSSHLTVTEPAPPIADHPPLRAGRHHEH